MNNEEQPHPVDAHLTLYDHLRPSLGMIAHLHRMIPVTEPPPVPDRVECNCVNCPDDCDCGCVDCWPDCTCECHEEEWKEYRS